MTKKSASQTYDSNPFTLSFKGFGLFSEFARGVVIAIVVLSSVGFLLNFTSSNFSESSKPTTREITSDATISGSEVAGLLLIVSAVVVVGFLIACVISAAFKGFSAAGMQAALHGKPITLAESLTAMADRFKALLMSEIIVTGKIIGGLLLFVIPGVRAYLRYQAVPFLLMEHPTMSAQEAIAESKKLYRGHLMEIFGIGFVGGIIPFIGQALTTAGVGMSLQQIAAYDKAGKTTPKTHWLNYLPIYLLILFAVFGILLGLVIYLLSN